MIEKILDPYELKARVAPGLILAMPILVIAVFFLPVLSSLPIFTAGGLCSVALVYGLGHVLRALGDRIEEKLWLSWGGPPSTRFMRHRDSKFGGNLKASIAQLLAVRFSAHLLSADDEARNPGMADSLIVDAFRQVRQYLRQHDPDGLWSKHNAEYGFCRNLLASRVLWVFISLFAVVFAVFYSVGRGESVFNPASVVGVLSLLCAIPIGWNVLPEATKRAGEAYAESAWMAFLACEDSKSSAQAH
jgi:hypothetical protein